MEYFLLRNVVWVRCVDLVPSVKSGELIVWFVWPRSTLVLVSEWARLLVLDFVFLREFDAVRLREPLLDVWEEVVVGMSVLSFVSDRSGDFVSVFPSFNRRPM